MARCTREWSQAKFERYIKEGRGQGSGENYKPWISVSDFPSMGRSARSPGWKTNRVHHLLSDHERRLFYLFEWSDMVVDIREQFPLLDLDLCTSIARDMGMKYPTDPVSGTPYVLTTDFMLTVNQSGKSVQIARTVKPSSDLEKKSVAEKFELERRYYADQNIDWGIVTEKEIPRLLVLNIEWIHSSYSLEATSEMEVEQLRGLSTILKSRLQKSSATINKVTTALDREMNIEAGTSLMLFKHLLVETFVQTQPTENEHPLLRSTLETARQIETQDVEVDTNGEVKLRSGVAKERRISVEDEEMRHGRKSRSQKIDGYKRHVLRDLDNGMIRAVGITKANVPEASVTDAITQDLTSQDVELTELHIDRAYLSSTFVKNRSEQLKIYCKAWVVHNG
ncbi:TnsA endonuclease C-terminal domain-containing protein [Tolypothrix sp. FACHB-123]|uniref:TnsA endonuclease C-terminal domain-containing protein n=1 Tax=Tolypothrix sp. FACHB-123 TaxID=2692868 RepID=UPI001F54FECB|nr:TnsA endonuclease C-terminal domain-containing protein [Tolypothrix sp. FACHB-123]